LNEDAWYLVCTYILLYSNTVTYHTKHNFFRFRRVCCSLFHQILKFSVCGSSSLLVRNTFFIMISYAHFFTKGIFILSIQKLSRFQLINLFSNCNADKEPPSCFILIKIIKRTFSFRMLSKSFCIFLVSSAKVCSQF